MVEDVGFRVKLLEALVIISIFTTSFLILIISFVNQAFALVLCFVLLAYGVLFFMIKRKINTFTFHSNFVVGIVFVQMLTVPIMDALDSLIVGWIVLYPIVIFTFKSPRAGSVIGLLFIISLLTLYASGLLNESYKLTHISMLSLIFTVFSVLLFFLSGILRAQEKKLRELNDTLENRINETVRDIQQKEKLMLHQNRLAQMGEMISMIAHQWRQPLTTIASISGTLQLKMGLNKYDKEIFNSKLKDIDSHTVHLSHTINDFKDFFKPNKIKTFFNIEATIHNALHLMSPLFESKEIDIQVNIDNHLNKEIESYENELIQVFLNIFKNSADVFEEQEILNPKINVSLTDDDTYVNILIEDNGGGISDETLAKVFDPYFSTKSSQNGTGIGLYMSKSIIEEHCNGNLSVDNNGQGALFSISIPCC